MSPSKHTPEPWTIGHVREKVLLPPVAAGTILISNSELPIAGRSNTPIALVVGNPKSAEILANAALISLSPRLAKTLAKIAELTGPKESRRHRAQTIDEVWELAQYMVLELEKAGAL